MDIILHVAIFLQLWNQFLVVKYRANNAIQDEITILMD